MVGCARHDKQQVGKPIQIDANNRFDRIAAQCERRAFGAPTHCARDVQCRTRQCPAGKNKMSQRRQLCFESIDPSFETRDALIVNHDFRDSLGNAVGGVGKSRSERKEIALEGNRDIAKLRIETGRRGEPETGLNLVHLTVRDYTRIGF